MPPITLHMVLSLRIADVLPPGALSGPPGAYLLGATTPDIRVLTRQDRRSTHFFDLSVHDHQDSVAAFLETYGQLADPAHLNEPTTAFVAGYVSHLVMDEQYITRMYRRYFGDHDTLGGPMRTNVMDRLLQFEMERRSAGEPSIRRRIADALARTIHGIEIGFIDGDTLDRWRGVTVEMAQRNMDWERTRALIGNHLRFSGLEEGETMASFLDSLPELLDETIAHITSDEIEGFLERCTEVAGRAVERYLGCG